MTLYQPRPRQSGFTLVELMVSIALGLIVVLALITLLINVSRSNNEMAKTNRQIENGRFALQILQSDLELAGYWGPLGYTGTNPMPLATAVPNPCLPTANWDAAHQRNLLAIPVQGYKNLTFAYANGKTLTECGVSGLLNNSDVMVVSHANTCAAGTANCDGGTDTGPHIQVSACRDGESEYVVATPPANAASAPATFPLRRKDCATLVPEIYKVVSNIYYLASQNGQPTLMRASLAKGVWTTTPLIAGIEAFRIEYGIDTDQDGSANSFVACNPCTLDQLNNVVAAKVYVLARSLEVTPGYTDTKTYQLGGTTINPLGGGFKRHVFSTTVRLVNPSGRRES